MACYNSSFKTIFYVTVYTESTVYLKLSENMHHEYLQHLHYIYLLIQLANNIAHNADVAGTCYKCNKHGRLHDFGYRGASP